MLAFKNPLDTDVDRPGWNIGDEDFDTKQVYAGPKYGMKTREEYNKLLQSGALGRGQQAVELTGQQIFDHGKNIYNKVGEVIPDFDLPEMSPEVKNAINTAGQIAGKVWEISGLQRQVNQTMNILDAPVKAIAWTSKQVDPTKRGIGEAPLRVAETALPFVGGAKNLAKKGIQKGLQYSDEVADAIKISQQLQPAYTGAASKVDDVIRVADDLPSTAQPLQAVSGVNPQRTLRGSEYIKGLKTVVKSDPPIKDVQGFVKTGAKELIENKPQRIERYLNRGLSKHLKSKYKNSRSGYWNAKKLANDPKLLNKVIDRHDEVTDLFNKYKKSPTTGNQRELYDKIGESYFDDSALIYGGHSLGKKARKKLVEVSQWFSKDHWHHIFGNKEIGEFMLTEVAQDPLIGINLFKHMKKRGLSVSGVADNILIMKEKGHKNFHEFLRAIGIEGKYGRTAVGGFEDYGQEISKVVQGRAQAAKTFTTETGEVIQKGTRYPADPEAVNELFTMIDAYAEQNKWIRQKFKEGAITVMEPTGSKGLRKVVPNGYKAKKGESVFVYDLTANKGGKPQLPEVYSDKAGRIKKVLDET